MEIHAVSPIQEPRRGSRRGNRKTRTGCLTCKIRRVKCDETKPHCIRCTKFGRTCDGYAQPNHRATKIYSTNNGEIVIKPKSNQLHIRNPTILPPGNAIERRYFQWFCRATSRELSGDFENAFWAQIVLQTAHHEASVRHAATAIAALTKTLEAAPVNSYRIDVQTVRDEHYKFGIEQYSKAVSHLREDLATKKNGLRTALIAAMLFACIETLQGEQGSASKQIHHGLVLLEQAQQACYNKDRDQIIEEGLLQMWNAQNVQSYYLCFTQAPLHPPMLPKHLQDRHRHVFSSSMPRFFTSVSDAKRTLDLLMNATAQFNYYCMSGPFKEVRRYAELHAQLSQWEAAFQPLLEKARADVDTSKSLNPISVETRVATLLLSVYHCVALILLSGAITPTETMYDSLTREFGHIVSMARKILEISLPLDSPPGPSKQNSRNSCHGPRFTFDVSILPPLHIVGTKCRDPFLRREAIRLLRQSRVQEGFWAPQPVAETCNWMMEVEEAGIVTTTSDQGEGGSSRGHAGNFFIPEESRIRLTGLLCELNQRRVRVQCTGAVALSGSDARKEKPVWEKTITW